MDQIAEVFLLLQKRNRADNLPGGAGCRERTKGEAARNEARARLLAHLALQVEARVAVGEVLPEQQGVFVLLPGQAVTVVVEVEGLPPVGARAGMREQPGSSGPGRGLPAGCPRAQEQRPEGTCAFSMERSSSNAQHIHVRWIQVKMCIPKDASLSLMKT